jgi:hypothetical protein
MGFRLISLPHKGFLPLTSWRKWNRSRIRTPRLVRGLSNSSTPLDISFENKKHTPTTKRGDHSNNTQHSSEGQSSKAIRCARERTGAGRLVFGEDVAMDKVLDLSERAVVGRVRGKKLGMDYLKSWVHNY